VQITRNQPVRPEKLEAAKRLRQRMTPEEKMLWRALRNNQLDALHFRRQQVIAGYIVDFYCASAWLAIEIDGGSHDGRTEYDARRDHALAEMGIRTIRISNESVTGDLDGVLRMIAEHAAATPKPHP
jgi:very-short-patch-repair endonuclease